MRPETITNENPLILASQSPRRKRLLQQLRIPFKAIPSHIPEEGMVGDPQGLAVQLASEKALSIRDKAEAHWILGADTIVEINGDVLGKPKDEADAAAMLGRLSGQRHRVVTGFSLVNPMGILAHSEVVVTEVQVKQLSPQEIQAYIRTGEPFGKAGSYAIQGIGAFMVEAISGSYTNVVGLPLCAVVKALVSTGALKQFPL